VLPLEKFAEICRKVYFAIDDYSEVDLVIANGYLSYIFSEYIVVSGHQDYQEYCLLCRKNLQDVLSRMPLLSSPSMELIAAWTLGVHIPYQKGITRTLTDNISTVGARCH
jgi:hypothetical protein